MEISWKKTGVMERKKERKKEGKKEKGKGRNIRRGRKGKKIARTRPDRQKMEKRTAELTQNKIRKVTSERETETDRGRQSHRQRKTETSEMLKKKKKPVDRKADINFSRVTNPQ